MKKSPFITVPLLLGLLLGAMMALDMGGPINKAAYASSAALISSGVYAPMAAVMLAGMTPPLGSSGRWKATTAVGSRPARSSASSGARSAWPNGTVVISTRGRGAAEVTM